MIESYAAFRPVDGKAGYGFPIGFNGSLAPWMVQKSRPPKLRQVRSYVP